MHSGSQQLHMHGVVKSSFSSFLESRSYGSVSVWLWRSPFWCLALIVVAGRATAALVELDSFCTRSWLGYPVSNHWEFRAGSTSTPRYYSGGVSEIQVRLQGRRLAGRCARASEVDLKVRLERLTLIMGKAAVSYIPRSVFQGTDVILGSCVERGTGTPLSRQAGACWQLLHLPQL